VLKLKKNSGETDMNYNLFLENSKRTCLVGRNIYSNEGYCYNGQWNAAISGFRSSKPKGIAFGHQIEENTVIYPEIYENGKLLEFNTFRHRWTPAWQITHYRSNPDKDYYQNSGCISFSETKCIDVNDNFYSKIKLNSDKREDTEITIKLVGNLLGEINLPIKIGALNRELHLNGFAACKNTYCNKNEFNFTLKANSSIEFSYCFAFSKESFALAEKSAKNSLITKNPFLVKENAFNKFINDNAPILETENTDLLKIYYYRWFLIYRNLHKPSDVISDHYIPNFTFYESPFGNWYGSPVGLPVPHHIEETKWMKNPEFVFKDTENWINALICHRGYIQYTPMAISHLLQNHKNDEFLEKAYNICYEYCFSQEGLDGFNLEKEGLDFLPSLHSSWNTGAEYQPNFFEYTNPSFDWIHDKQGIKEGLTDESVRLYRLDHIAYLTGNLIGTAEMAKNLCKADDYDYLINIIEKIKNLLKTKFWSKKRGCFVSIDYKTGKKCENSVCYDSLSPFLWNIIDKEYYSGFKPLFNENSLYNEFGVLSCEKTCPMYWFDNCITGPINATTQEPHYYSCSWNGPIWPYAFSTVLEALGLASTKDDSLKEGFIDLFNKYTELHFMQGDRSTPLITEHYRPNDAKSFSVACDYFHSTWIDLFMKYYAGITVTEDSVEFNPLTNEEFTLKDVVISGKHYNFTQKYENDKLIKNIDII